MNLSRSLKAVEFLTEMRKGMVFAVQADPLWTHWPDTGPPLEDLRLFLWLSYLLSLLISNRSIKKYLQFLALPKCHEEICARQRNCLQIIMEHGEKLAVMIQLRDMQTNLFHSLSHGMDLSSPRTASAFWDLIRAVGEKNYRDNVLLMDQDNAEVFYSEVSDVEVFRCVSVNIQDIVGKYSLIGQVQRISELASALTSLIRTAVSYRTIHHIWYPPSEGLTAWYCQNVMRTGLWAVGSFILQMLKEASGLDLSLRSDLYSLLKEVADVLLEAYSGAITAKMERGEVVNGLRDKFWKIRDELLCSLYEQIKKIVEARMLDPGETDVGDITEQKKASLQECVCLCCSLQGDMRGIKLYGLFVVILMMSDCSLTLCEIAWSQEVVSSLSVFKQLYEKQ